MFLYLIQQRKELHATYLKTLATLELTQEMIYVDGLSNGDVQANLEQLELKGTNQCSKIGYLAISTSSKGD